MNQVDGQTLSFHPVPDDACAETIKFGTKAETLERLKSRLTTAVVLDQVRFTASQWGGSAKTEVLAQIERLGWNKLPLIVRSSARSEDQTNSSLAGHFLSVLNVEGQTAFIEAVDRVFASYGESAFDEQILVQPMVANVVASGVAFSIDPNTGSPYLVINYVEGSDTAEITSGHKNTRSMYCFKDADVSQCPELIRNLSSLIRELEVLLGTDKIDIEFALDAFNVLYLLQCRPLVYSGVVPSTADLRPYLEEIEGKVKSLSQPHPYLLGSKTIFGIMPDWNPAEIVGVRPKPLALSMYQELITDSIWAYQRSNYGYRNLRSFPLIVSLCGLPYVDVRVDFNSFVPADVDHALGDKLVNYYLNKLAASPAHHDKVEFEIVYTCYTFDLPERIKTLTASGFDHEECNVLARSLRSLTNHIMHEKDGLWKKDIEKIAELEERLNTIADSDLDTVSKIYWQM